MSQHIPQHHIPQYVHYTGPPGSHLQIHHANIGISPQDITRQPMQAVPQLMHQPLLHQPHPQTVHHHQLAHMHPHPQQHIQQSPPQQPEASANAQAGASTSSNNNTGPIVATAKTAELKKHALTLQLHTAHILSAHATLEQKSKAIQDIREQKNRLESERTRLLDCLRQVNEDRDKADLAEATVTRECDDLRSKITQLTDGEYCVAKRDVDRLRQELGQSPLPSIQSTLDEKSQQ
ncbi:hypothetical protein BDQ17DRAFT_1320859 [Cyathus striatus]|nr:hypothetical protein BDQ17DRAFT_1320859 [Cyathus striatus]